MARLLVEEIQTIGGWLGLMIFKALSDFETIGLHNLSVQLCSYYLETVILLSQIKKFM